MKLRRSRRVPDYMRERLFYQPVKLAFLDGSDEDFLGTLPSPGDSGTMSFVMSGYPESIRSRILIKSGSMNGVLCYSGYILPESMDNDIVVFSIMTNNCTSTPYLVRKSVERILALLAGY